MICDCYRNKGLQQHGDNGEQKNHTTISFLCIMLRVKLAPTSCLGTDSPMLGLAFDAKWHKILFTAF